MKKIDLFNFFIIKKQWFNYEKAESFAEGYRKGIEDSANSEKLKIENQQLKQLLKECRPYIIQNIVFTTMNKITEIEEKDIELITKIDKINN